MAGRWLPPDMQQRNEAAEIEKKRSVRNALKKLGGATKGVRSVGMRMHVCMCMLCM